MEIDFNVRAMAEARGYTDWKELAYDCHIPFGSMKPIWFGQSQAVYLATLAKICRTLNCAPGTLFTVVEHATTSEHA